MRTFRSTMCMAALAAGINLGQVFAAEGDFRKGFSSVARKASPAVVFIQVEKQIPVGEVYPFFNNPFEWFGEGFSDRFGRGDGRYHQPRRGRQPNQQMYKMSGQGSGFLISKDGYILTNTHVVGDVDKITVKLSDGREFIAKRIGADKKTEVALVKIEGNDFPCLSIGDPSKLEIGEWVVAIGNPFGLKETLTVGVVSAKGRTNIGITDYEDFIQTDAAINPGNSGGPLLNVDAEVVGINTAIYSQSGGYMGIGFAVPIDMAMSVKSQLITSGKVTRGYIGISMNPGELGAAMAKSFGRDEAGGVLIADVKKDSPADKAGLKSGDIVVELNGKKIVDNSMLAREVARIMPKEKANLLVYSDGKEKSVSVIVAPFPDDKDLAVLSGESGDLLEKIGFDIQDLTADVASRLGYEEGRGVLVSEVRPGSSAQEAGLRPGMLIIEVNRRGVNTTREFLAAMRKEKGKTLLIRVKTEQGTLFLNLNAED